MPDLNDHIDEIVLDDSLVAAARAEARSRMESAFADALTKLETLGGSLTQGVVDLERWYVERREQDRRFHDFVAAANQPMTEHLAELIRQVANLTEQIGRLATAPPTTAPVTAAAEGEVAPAAARDAVDQAATAGTESALGFGNAPPPADAGASETWERVLFGDQLCELAPLANDREMLLDGVLRRDGGAVGLASRLMLVQAAAADEVPSLLKEIGEAYYRWRPKTADIEDAFEQALAVGLRERIAAVGLRNTIELVRVGDRYDSSRHTSSDRGIEVTAVGGWVVLRENGKALTKALVSLR